MLKELAKQKGEIFENFFTEAFQNRFNVECDWGFPVVSLSIKSKEESEIKNNWTFRIDTRTEEYSFTSEGYRYTEEGEEESKKIIILPVSIDSNTINFIVKNVVSITEKIFEPNKTTETETETETEIEVEEK